MPEDKDDRRPSSDRVDRDAFEREIATDLDEETPDKPKGMALHTKILIGLAVGTIAGVTVNQMLGGDHPRVAWVVDNITHPVGQLFLRLLLMIVVPLVFSSLVVGVAGIGDIRKLGRVGLKSFAYCLVISAISVVIGSRSPTRSSPADESIPPRRRRCSNATPLTPRKLSQAATQASTHVETFNAGGGNDRSEEPVFCDLRQRRSKHASPHVFRIDHRYRDHAASGDGHNAFPARARRSLSRSRQRSSRSS